MIPAPEASPMAQPGTRQDALIRKTSMFDVRVDDLSGEQTRMLLALHLAGMEANSPPEHVFALDLSGLKTPDVTVWTAWLDQRVAAVGALKLLPDGAAEVKSMRTHPGFLRKGAGASILEAIITAAKERGVSRLSLETGSGEAFEPALSLYRRQGFSIGPAFGEYTASCFNQFLHLDLDDRPCGEQTSSIAVRASEVPARKNRRITPNPSRP